MVGIRQRLLGALLGVLAAGCQAHAEDALGRVKATGTLAVGIDAAVSPTIAGFDGDLFAEVGHELGVTVVWVAVAGDAVSSGLDDRRFVVAAGPFAVSGAPGRHVLAPVAMDGDALLKRRGDGTVLKPSDIAGKAVGVIGAPSEAAQARRAAAALHARVTSRLSFQAPNAESDLAAGRLAAVAGPLDAVAGTALARPDAFEVVGPVFGATSRLGPVASADPDAAALADAVRAAILRITADGRLAALQRKWFGLVFEPPAVPAASNRPPLAAAAKP